MATRAIRFLLAILFVSGFTLRAPLIASADAPARDTAEWYCHEGAVLMHAGMKNSQSSPVGNWDGNLLSKASDNYIECYRRAESSDDVGEQLYAIKGYAAARIEYAELIHLISLQGFEFLPPAKAREAFTKLHTFAVHTAGQALEAYNTASDLLSRLDPSDDGYLELSQNVDSNKQTVAIIKETIMKATLDNIPRNKAELGAWFETNRIPTYSVGSNFGLTREERCPTKSTPITVDGPVHAPLAGTTGIKVEVGADGTLRSAHIVQSSGNTDADETALTSAFHLKYHAATNRCDSIASSTTIWI